MEFLHRKNVTKRPQRNPIGLFADLKLDLKEADIAEVRQEVWEKFPRDIEL